MRSPQQLANDMAKLVADLTDTAQAGCISQTSLNAAQQSLMTSLIQVEVDKRISEAFEVHAPKRRPSFTTSSLHASP